MKNLRIITKLRKYSPLFCILLLASCASKKTKDISYIEGAKTFITSLPKLDIYQPRKSENNPVVIFIHGGYWDEGDKNIYGFLGRGFAKKDVTTVIPNYTLSPDGNYNTMAKEVAKAIQWTYDSISKYRGNPEQIFLMGHSAGGHLIALVSTNPKYLKNTDIIKGVILNDAAGLDMYSYLKEKPPTQNHNYDVTWTQDSSNWKDASPIYFLSEETPPLIIFVGTKTYPPILSSNKEFIKKLNTFQPEVEINYQKKKHVPMMSQFALPWNKNYKKIISFIETNKLQKLY